MAIDAVNAISLQPLAAETSLGAALHGQVVVARVVAVLSETAAKLSVFGHTIEVATPQPLTPGSTLKLEVQQDANGQVTFVAHTGQDSPQTPTQTSAASQALSPKPDTPSGILSTALSGARASIVHAILDGEFVAQQAPPATDAQNASQENTFIALLTPSYAKPQTQAPPTQLTQDVRAEALAPAPSSLAKIGVSASSSTSLSVSSAQTHAAASSATTALANQAATYSRSFTIPVTFPQGPATLHFQVTRHDDDAPQNRPSNASPSPPSWSLRFAVNAEPLGPVHAYVHLTQGKVSVRLWAERGETAQDFKRAGSELASAMKATDLNLEDFSVAEGSALMPADTTLSEALS